MNKDMHEAVKELVSLAGGCVGGLLLGVGLALARQVMGEDLD